MGVNRESAGQELPIALWLAYVQNYTQPNNSDSHFLSLWYVSGPVLSTEFTHIMNLCMKPTREVLLLPAFMDEKNQDSRKVKFPKSS